MDIFREAEGVDFGPLPGPVDTLLQQGVVAYRSDRLRADRLFRQALDLAPQALAAHLCLYKIHTYMGNLEVAKTAALDGLREAARPVQRRRRGAFRPVHPQGAQLHRTQARRPRIRRPDARYSGLGRSGGQRRLASDRSARGRRRLTLWRAFRREMSQNRRA